MRSAHGVHTARPSQPAAEPIEVRFAAPHLARLRLGAGTAPELSYLPPVSETDGPFAPSSAFPARLSAEELEIRFLEHPSRLEFLNGLGEAKLRLLLGATADGRLRLSFETVGEQHFHGLGQGGAPFDRLGTSRRLWNCHVNHGLGGDISIPLLLSDAGYALFFDNPRLATLDAGSSYDAVCFDYLTGAEGFDLYCIWAGDLRALLGRIARFLGRAPMPPRWALGYLQSTRHFETADEIRELARQFRARRLPCDGLALLSTYGEARGWNRGVGHLQFQPDLFGEPERLLRDLRDLDFRIITHEYPVVHEDSPLHGPAEAGGHLLDEGYPDGRPAGRRDNYHEGQRFLDFSHEGTGLWWWEQHQDLLRCGVDGWWLDGGEGPMQPGTDGDAGLHNRYDLLRQQAFAEGEARDRPGRRPFFLARSGGPGMQRFGVACWSGDIDGSFAALEAQIAIGLNVGLSGVPYWGTDIGGYYPSAASTPELFARWFAFGAFCPVFRGHGRQWRMHTPWAHGPEIEAICRGFLELRSRLMPYTYSLAREAHRHGLPLMRPLALNYPEDEQCRGLASQYLWGDDLLVAPVTRPGATHWPVYLPAGAWHDFWTGERHTGGRGITVAAPLDRIPLFVRSGAILPLGPVAACWDGCLPDTLTLLTFPAGDGAFDLYEDDGDSHDYAGGGFVLTRFECAAGPEATSLRIGAPRGAAGLIPPGRFFEVRIHAPHRPERVSIRRGAAAEPGIPRMDGEFLRLGPIAGPAKVHLTW